MSTDLDSRFEKMETEHEALRWQREERERVLAEQRAETEAAIAEAERRHQPVEADPLDAELEGRARRSWRRWPSSSTSR